MSAYITVSIPAADIAQASHFCTHDPRIGRSSYALGGPTTCIVGTPDELRAAAARLIELAAEAES